MNPDIAKYKLEIAEYESEMLNLYDKLASTYQNCLDTYEKLIQAYEVEGKFLFFAHNSINMKNSSKYVIPMHQIGFPIQTPFIPRENDPVRFY